MTAQRDVRRGALLLSLSALLFSCMGVAVREASTLTNNETIVFARNLVGVLVFLPLIGVKGIQPLRTRHLHLHLSRAGYGLAAMYCFFYAIAKLPLADAMLFTYSAPVFTPLIAHWWLKETLTPRIQIFSLLGLAGVWLVAKPSGALLDAMALVGLGASILAACAFVSVRQLGATEPAFRTVFYFALFSTLASAIPLTWAWQPLSTAACGWLLLVGLLATLSQWVMSCAYALAPMNRISPFAYLAIVFSATLGWLLWQEIPDTLSLAGTLLIVGAGLSTLFLNRDSSRSAV